MAGVKQILVSILIKQKVYSFLCLIGLSHLYFILSIKLMFTNT